MLFDRFTFHPGNTARSSVAPYTISPAQVNEDHAPVVVVEPTPHDNIPVAPFSEYPVLQITCTTPLNS